MSWARGRFGIRSMAYSTGSIARHLQSTATIRCSGSVRTWPVPADIGSMALRQDGGAVMALSDGFYTFDFDVGQAALIAKVDQTEPRTRLNDGKADRRGRFFAGGMDVEEADGLAGLYRLDPDMTVTRVADGIVVFNGPCWSPDDTIFYYADSWTAIYACDYDVETGTLSNRKKLYDLAAAGFPADGSTIDEEGFIWNAQTVGGKLVRYAPNGEVDREISFPVKNLTSVMFGGDRLDVMYVTSMARIAHPPGTGFARQDRPEPMAGGLFEVAWTGRPRVTGAPFRWLIRASRGGIRPRFRAQPGLESGVANRLRLARPMAIKPTTANRLRKIMMISPAVDT